MASQLPPIQYQVTAAPANGLFKPGDKPTWQQICQKLQIPPHYPLKHGSTSDAMVIKDYEFTIIRPKL